MNRYSKYDIVFLFLACYIKVIVKKHKFSRVLIFKPGSTLETPGEILKNTDLVNQNAIFLGVFCFSFNAFRDSHTQPGLGTSAPEDISFPHSCPTMLMASSHINQYK